MRLAEVTHSYREECCSWKYLQGLWIEAQMGVTDKSCLSFLRVLPNKALGGSRRKSLEVTC